MEILETIPIYGPPMWPIILILCGLGLVILSITVLNDTEYADVIVALIGVAAAIVAFVFLIILRNAEFKRNEYIVRITDITTQEFVQQYEVTKRFEYSDIIQIKEIEK